MYSRFGRKSTLRPEQQNTPKHEAVALYRDLRASGPGSVPQPRPEQGLFRLPQPFSHFSLQPQVWL
jgi:hypothetical protein